jgi:hypothetical protein
MKGDRGNYALEKTSKQPRNCREKRKQGKESSTEEEDSKKLAARLHEQQPDAAGTLGETQGRVCKKRPAL